MIYSNPNPSLKKIVLIGAIAIAIVLAVLAIVVISFFFKDKALETPNMNLLKLQQQKMQKDIQKAAKILKDTPIPEQQIKEDMNTASEEVKKIPIPSQEDMQKAAEQLNKSLK